jgi:hypothetical protein
MKLSEIFTQLTHGEFSQLSIGGADKGQIQESNYAAVIAHINLGLTALYRRFPLKEGRILLRPQADTREYLLANRFAVSDTRSTEPVRYLIDSAGQPFKEDTLIKIERVLDLSEEDVLLNVEGDPESCFTPAYNVIRIPKEATNDLILVFRQNHAQIPIPFGYVDPVRVEVDLPYSYLDALLYFVASRAHNPVGMQNEFHKGNSYYAKYEAICAELERNNVKPDTMHENSRLVRNGWV